MKLRNFNFPGTLALVVCMLPSVSAIPVTAPEVEERAAAPYDPDCPPGILPTPSFGTKDGVFSVCSTIYIEAPSQNVYNILKNFDGYPAWNSFVVRVDKKAPGPYGLNSTMTFNNAQIFPLVNYPSDERVSVWNKQVLSSPIKGTQYPELHVAWALDTMAPGALNAEHLTIVRDFGNGTAKVVSFETYYGTLAPAVELVTGTQLKMLFPKQNADLKAWAESGHSS